MLVDACVVCGAPPRKWSYNCDRCRRQATYRTYVNRRRAMAMKAAWCEERDGFLCAYTGMKVDERDAESSWAFCIDHAVPGDEGMLVRANPELDEPAPPHTRRFDPSCHDSPAQPVHAFHQVLLDPLGL
jgi:hypothetical protein